MDHVIGEPTDSEKRSFSYAPYDPLPSEGTHNGYLKGGVRSFVAVKLMSEANGFYGDFVAVKLNFYSFFNHSLFIP